MVFNKPKRKPKQSSKWFPILIIVMVVGGLVVVTEFVKVVEFIADFNEDSFDYSGEEAKLQIENTLQATIPNTGSNFEYSGSSWIDTIVWMRFNLPAEDIPSFLTSAGGLCSSELINDMNPLYEVEMFEWWHPETASTYAGMEQCHDHNSGLWLSLMIDQSDKTDWIVYVYGFTT